MAIKLKITGIGSLPYEDVISSCERILKVCPFMPFWPQMVRLSSQEGMLIQFLEGFDFIKTDPKGALKIVDSKERDSALASFYEKVFSLALTPFAISEERAQGLYTLLRLLGETRKAERDNYIKGQVVGPFTLGLAAKDHQGQSSLADPEIWEAIITGITKKILWQVNLLEGTGRKVVIFMDEPSLSGYGSAFSTITEAQLIESFSRLINDVKAQRDVLLGIHCCGNTDWGLLLRSGIDIISLDSFGFSEKFFLYSKDIKKFLENKGMIAWGYVPTSEDLLSIPKEEIKRRLIDCLHNVMQLGFDISTILDRSIFTPSCGMGSMSIEAANMVFEVLSMTDEFTEV